MAEAPPRYCSNCGHELRPEEQFCSNCGTPALLVSRKRAALDAHPYGIFGDAKGTRRWNVEGERLLRDIRVPGDGLSADYSVTFSSDGELIAAGGSDGEVSVWSVRDGRLLWTEVGHHRYVTALAFSPDDDLLVSGGIDGKVKLWRSEDGHLLQAHGRSEGYTGAVVGVAFNPEKERVISFDRADGYVRIWPKQTPYFFERLVPQ